MPVHLFLGPTLPRGDALDILPEAVLHPPAAHGDLLRLGCARGDVVVLVDGYYHHSAPVRHKEILALLYEGVSVIGCASMGAVRAAELSRYGMVGNGAVFEMYCDGVLDSDAEVAVTHTEAPEYRKLTVALVVVRHAAESARLTGVLSGGEACVLVDLARSLHYTERSWESLRAATAAYSDELRDAWGRLGPFMAGQPRQGDVKAADTVDTLAKIARGELRETAGTEEWPANGEWRNRFVTEWQAQFSVTKVDGVEVGRSATIRHQQVYLGDFPLRWRRFVLAHVAGDAVTTDLVSLEDRALAVAAHSGLTPESLTAKQTGHWLTEEEATELPGKERVLRVLVRSYQSASQTNALAVAEVGLAGDPQAQRAVAEAQVINAEVASWASGQSVDQLKPAVLREHLASVWHLGSADEPALLAAARDRGFASVERAVDAVRPFFLRARFQSIGPR